MCQSHMTNAITGMGLACDDTFKESYMTTLDTPFFTIFLELRPVTQKQYATLCDPKMYQHTKFGTPTSNNFSSQR